MPHTTVHHEHTACGTGRLHFGWVGDIRIYAVVSGRVVVRPVAAGDDQGAPVFAGKRGEHPQRRDVHRCVGVGRGDMAGVILIKGPITVPSSTLISRIVDRAGGEGYPRMGSQQVLRQGQACVGQPSRERLIDRSG